LESSARYDVYAFGITQEAQLAAVRSPTTPTWFYSCNRPSSGVVKIWEDGRADERIVNIGSFFPFPLTPAEWLAVLNGGPI